MVEIDIDGWLFGGLDQVKIEPAAGIDLDQSSVETSPLLLRMRDDALADPEVTVNTCILCVAM